MTDGREEMSAGKSQAGPLLLISAAVLLWTAFLIGLAATTANPVVLNRHQIKESRWVVEGVVSDSGELTITRSIIGEFPEPTIRLSDEVRWHDIPLIVPLVREFGDYRITPTLLPGPLRLTYPLNEATLDQLSKIRVP